MRGFIFTFLFYLIVSVNGIAQTAYSTKSDSAVIIRLHEVEVKALYGNLVSRRFPVSVYVLESGDQNITLPINITESLNKIPSVFAHTGTLNTSRITMRGIGTRSLYGTRKINALLNDIPLTSGEGDTFFDDIDIQFINRIEIIGGPTAGIYGPSLGGTLLLTTGEVGKNKSIYVNSGIGSFGTLQNLFHTEFGNGKTGGSVSLKNIKSDGYRDNNDYQRNSALVTLNSKLKRSSLNAVFLYTGVNAEIPSSIDSLTFESNSRAAAANWLKTRGRENTVRMLSGLNYKYVVNATLNMESTVYGLYKQSQEVRPFDFLDETDQAGGFKFRLKKQLTNFPGLTITPGISVFFEKYQAKLYENQGGVGRKGSKTADNLERIYQGNVYTIVDYDPDLNNFFSLSGNLNKTVINDKNLFAGSSVQVYSPGIYFSPRLSYSHKVRMNHFLFANLSHGLSFPSVQEILYPDGTINKKVKPEKAWSFEMGLKGVQLFNEVKYSLSVYYMPVKDLIVPDRIAEDTYVGKNIGRSTHSGVELSVQKSFPVTKSIWFYLADYNLTVNIQSNKFGSFPYDTLNLKGNNLPGVPDQRLFLSVLFKMKRFLFFEPEFYINGKMAMTDDNSRLYNGYDIVNVHFGLQWTKRWFNLQVASRINNLLDKNYASMILINAPSANGRAPRYFYPGNPRNWYFSVSLGFDL